MEPTEKQLLFSPKAFQKPEEKPDLTTAWAYIIIDGPLDKDPKNWPKQIIRAGQCATIVPKARMEKQKYEWLKKGRLEEIEKAKLLVVKRFDGPKAESSSIEWEFLIHAHRAKMSLESGPGQFKDEREYKSIYSFLAATNPSDELKVEVSRALTDVLYLESEGKYVEDPFRFECPKSNCDKTFEQLCHLQSHEKTHGDLTLSHECHQCGNAYSEKSALKRHLENDHSQEKPREIRKRQSSGRQEPYTCPEPKDEKCEKFKANDYKDFRRHLTTKKHGYVDKQVRAKYPQKQIRRRPAIENENIADLFSDVSEGEMDERNRYLATMDEDDSPPPAKIPRVEDDGPGTFSNSNRSSPYSI